MATVTLGQVNQQIWYIAANTPGVTAEDVRHVLMEVDIQLVDHKLDTAMASLSNLDAKQAAQEGKWGIYNLYDGILKWLHDPDITDVSNEDSNTYSEETVYDDAHKSGNSANVAPTKSQIPQTNSAVQVEATSDNVQLDQNGYINSYLGPAAVKQCYADTKTPPVPPSVVMACALAKTGLMSSSIGKNNFWNLDFNKELGCDDSADQNNKCAFADADKGVAGILIYCHTSLAKNIEPLKDSIYSDDDNLKKQVIKNIMNTIGSDKANDAVSNYDKYKLSNWDTPEKKADVEAGKNIDSAAASKIAGNLKRVDQLKHKFGVGFEERQAGEYVTLTRLPKNKTTPCEPIYPDLITVSDTIPQWIMTQAIAEYNKQVETQALADAGVKEPTTDKNAAAMDEWAAEMQEFQKDQFTKWVLKQGLDVSTEDALKQAKDKYDAAASAGEEGFKNGIYLPDETSQAGYQALIQKKQSIQESIDQKGQLGTHVMQPLQKQDSSNKNSDSDKKDTDNENADKQEGDKDNK